MINKDRGLFQYKGGDLVYIISPIKSQLHTASHKVTIKYMGPVVIYKIIDPHNYLLTTLDGRILRGFFKHERLKATITIKYMGPVAIYKVIDLHNFLLMTLDGRILRGLFKHERLKPISSE